MTLELVWSESGIVAPKRRTDCRLLCLRKRPSLSLFSFSIVLLRSGLGNSKIRTVLLSLFFPKIYHITMQKNMKQIHHHQSFLAAVKQAPSLLIYIVYSVPPTFLLLYVFKCSSYPSHKPTFGLMALPFTYKPPRRICLALIILD